MGSIIRLERNCIVFRGDENASSSQLLRGVVVLCVHSRFKIEDVHLQLAGTLRYSWRDPSLLGHKVNILDYRWPSFAGRHGETMTLPPGNYEWPFEYLFPGDTVESIEGIPEASIVYKLKATISRGKLAIDIHTDRHVRVIRTLSVDSLETMPTITVGNTWLDKIDYSVSLPTKAVALGSTIALYMNFTPLLKGLDLGDVLVTLLETRELTGHVPNSPHMREHRVVHRLSQWCFQITSDHWQEAIQGTGQEGWSLTKTLDMPKDLHLCCQDVNHHGIKVDHKLRVQIQLNNPDGHISELLIFLPIYLFISPHIFSGSQGNLLSHRDTISSLEAATAGPPGYGDHLQDQLYEENNICERLEVPSQRRMSRYTRSTDFDDTAPMATTTSTLHRTDVTNPPLLDPGISNLDLAEFQELNRVPTYRTAVQSPVRSSSQPSNSHLPDYRTATSMVSEYTERVGYSAGN
ncbi:hypothetical protein BGZ63DRAFT_138584 [Mariannaea sp. PMI_226]|nr:hypothetical protein BGZ63DRAFT_138584 [Mariannaea sp. PMI_226]